MLTFIIGAIMGAIIGNMIGIIFMCCFIAGSKSDEIYMNDCRECPYRKYVHNQEKENIESKKSSSVVKKTTTLLLIFSLLSSFFIGIEEQKIGAVDLYSSKNVVEFKPEKIEMDILGQDELECFEVGKLIDYEKEFEKKEEVKELTIEEMIEQACDKYNVSYKLCLAIARLETGWFKSVAFVKGNNPGGLCMKASDGKYRPMSFSSREEGVERFVSNLANYYISYGLDTPEKIGPKYCPGSQSWIRQVNALMGYEV